MKNSFNQFETKNGNAFANFQNLALTKTEKKNVQGGEDVVVIEDIIIL